jgi:hypothetical protein
MSSSTAVESLNAVSFRPVSSAIESPGTITEVCSELLVSEAAAVIVFTKNSLRVFIDPHFSSVQGEAPFLLVRYTPIVYFCAVFQSPSGM